MKQPFRTLGLVGILLLSSFIFLAPIQPASAYTVNNPAVCGFSNASSSCGLLLKVNNIGDFIAIGIQFTNGVDAGHNQASVTGVTDNQTNVWTLAKQVQLNFGANCNAGNCLDDEIWYTTSKAIGHALIAASLLDAVSGNTGNIEGIDVSGVTAHVRSSTSGTCLSPCAPSSWGTSSSLAFDSTTDMPFSSIFTGCGASVTLTGGTSYTSVQPSSIFDGGIQYGNFPALPSSPTNFAWSCSNVANWGNSMNAGVIFGGGTFTCVITNMDAGNYLLPSGKVYDFRCTVGSDAISGGTLNRITSVSVTFNDTINIIVLNYENDSNGADGFTGSGFRILHGNTVIGFGSGSATSSINLATGVRKIIVDFKVSLATSITDATNRGILLAAGNIAGVTRGDEYVQKNYFNILNGGGNVNTLKSGLCSRPSGYDIYEVSCRYQASPKSWMAVNSTWYQLQHYSAEFSIKLTCGAVEFAAGKCAPLHPPAGIQGFWEDYGHSAAGAKAYTNPGDWKVRFGLYHFDNTSLSYVKGINVQLQMAVGNFGTNDQWTDLSVAWFNGNTLIRNDTINNWVQPSPLGQESFWIDLWYSSNNASTSQGGRVGSYYTGMHNSGFLWWTSWSPKLQNNTDSQIFVPLLDHSNKVMPVAAAQFSKVFMNMSRPYNSTHGGAFYLNFNSTTRQFKSQTFTVVTVGAMTALATPLFNSAIVPIIQNTGFLSPLINAINYLAKLFINGLVTLGNIIWSGLGARFPWFTNAFGTFGTLVINFATLLGGIAGYLGAFLTFLSTLFGPLATIIGVIGSAWATIQGIYLPIFGGANLGAFITVLVLWVFWGWFMENAEKNNTGAFVQAATLAWRVTNAILLWTWSLAKILIDTIEGLIP